jgi:hypothetical protein
MPPHVALSSYNSEEKNPLQKIERNRHFFLRKETSTLKNRKHGIKTTDCKDLTSRVLGFFLAVAVMYGDSGEAPP